MWGVPERLDPIFCTTRVQQLSSLYIDPVAHPDFHEVFPVRDDVHFRSELLYYLLVR